VVTVVTFSEINIAEQLGHCRRIRPALGAATTRIMSWTVSSVPTRCIRCAKQAKQDLDTGHIPFFMQSLPVSTANLQGRDSDNDEVQAWFQQNMSRSS
jgi:hypothetical protein